MEWKIEFSIAEFSFVKWNATIVRITVTMVRIVRIYFAIIPQRLQCHYLR